MPPKKKIKSSSDAAKTLPGCNGRGPVNPPSTPKTNTQKSRALDLQDKGWLTEKVLADLNRELERHSMPAVKKTNGDVKARQINMVKGMVEDKVKTEDKGKGKAEVETNIESNDSKSKEEENKPGHEAQPEPDPEPAPVPEHVPEPAPVRKANAKAKKGKKKEQRRYTAEEKGKGRMPTLFELGATNSTIDEASPAPEISLAEKKSISQPQLEENASQPQPDRTISQSKVEQSTLQPQFEKGISRPQVEETIPHPQLKDSISQPQSEESISQPQLELSLETAPAVESDEQSDIFWKLIDFFNSAPPLPDPPAHSPSTPIPTTKSASVPLVTSVYSPVSSPLPTLSFSPSTLSPPSTLPGPEEYDDGDKWDSMSFEWTDDDPMELSGWDFPLKPALSIYTPNPWTEPNHKLDTIMTVEVEDGAFDVAQWLRDQYDANVETTANCKFEHPGSRPSGNPFAPLQNSFQNNNNNNNNAPRGSSAADFYLNRDAIQKDLQEERPEWILSAYGPGRDAPEQLWGGILEQSPEEMRLHAMTCEAAGNLQGAVSLRNSPLGLIYQRKMLILKPAVGF